ncbi:hypothetical protein B2J93_447 [Marssonina coronariae]|uniref:Uncharacterized protein n=1 Tax=Diplocarpon coronariae TaxID=2795749 RepID=A0A218YSA2_9HELO|nr:hypothetical protein B2J93_447 [Marssonina coronariae]
MAVKKSFDTQSCPRSPVAASSAYVRRIFAGHVLILGAARAVHAARGWDTSHVHEVLGCSNALDLVTSRFEATLQRRSAHDEHPSFDRYLGDSRALTGLYYFSTSVPKIPVSIATSETVVHFLARIIFLPVFP